MGLSGTYQWCQRSPRSSSPFRRLFRFSRSCVMWPKTIFHLWGSKIAALVKHYLAKANLYCIFCIHILLHLLDFFQIVFGDLKKWIFVVKGVLGLANSLNQILVEPGIWLRTWFQNVLAIVEAPLLCHMSCPALPEARLHSFQVNCLIVVWFSVIVPS